MARLKIEKGSRLLLLFVFVLLTATVSSAQRSSTTLTGVIDDPSGAVLAGARVELVRDGTVGQTTRSDDSGTFEFVSVPAGTYEIRASYEGFVPLKVPVTVTDRSVAALKLTMQPAGTHQESVVVADAGSKLSTDTSENQNSVQMTTETLNNLPVFDDDYVAAMSQFLDSGDLATGGVTLVVDGIEVNDPGMAPSAIKEVRINNNPYDVQYSRPGRGRIEITTRPGSVEYHGSFNFLFRDSELNAREPLALVRPPEQRRIYEGYFTGPIRDSKNTSFLVSIDRDEEDLQAVVFALGLSGPIQENVPTPYRNFLASGRVMHNFGENNKASWFFSYQDHTNKNQGVGGVTLPSAGTNTEFQEAEFRYSQDTVISSKLVNEFRFLTGHYYLPTSSISTDAQIVVAGALVEGGAQADQVRTEFHAALTEILSYSTGRHLIKGGIDIPDLSRRGLDNNVNSSGTFYFSDLADLAASRPYSFIQQQGHGHVVFLEKVLGVFVQDDFRLLPNLMISAGLRYYWQNYFHSDHNVAPRFSLAYSPRGDKKTVIRGGAGMFYDRTGPWPIFDLLLYNGSRVKNFVITNPGFPDPLNAGEQLSGQPVSIVTLDPTARIPYSIQYSAAVERQLLGAATLSVTYLGSRGIDRFRSVDINAPPAPLYLARPNPDFGQIRQIESSGRSAFDSLEVSLRGNVTKRVTTMAQYRLAWSRDNTSGIGYFPSNNYDLSGEWARSDWDRRNRLTLLATFDAGRHVDVGVALGAFSGAPYTETTGFDNFNDGLGNERPAGVPRNSLQGPGYVDLDLRVSRKFYLLKSKQDKGPTLNLGLDAFNAANHVNYTGYIGNLSSPLFGLPVSAQPPRRLQMSARFNF
jgi:hypothetical protein